MSRTKQPCGTVAAYRRHRAADEVPCGPCFDALSAKNAERRQGRSQRPYRQCADCGTKTRARTVCGSCRADRKQQEYALDGGDWVVRRGVKVWVPWEVAS